MAKQKNFYYIGVQTDSGMALVTGIDSKNRMCFWNTNDKPMKFSASTAKSLAEGLCMNLITAVVVQSFFELEGHFIKERGIPMMQSLPDKSIDLREDKIYMNDIEN